MFAFVLIFIDQGRGLLERGLRGAWLECSQGENLCQNQGPREDLTWPVEEPVGAYEYSF